ncbi:11334_t:CDS:2 [Ambispora gerdemannii]|uniref:11334_t:CDS:1 n=1 Tax=Ambispora gerdemannii TaxID=144530 RepID=A0A9N9DTH5_9GLOM|nr:11334_t:CDS:2 [Ambispora gerdemannii]
MADTTKGQASPNVHFFHITPPGARNSKCRVKEKQDTLWFTITREFLLPTAVEKDKIKARYENGVLIINVPKSLKSKAHQVNIDINQSNNLIKIEIDEVDFPTGNGDEKAKITEILFSGQEKDKLKDTFQDRKTYQMTFDSSKVEDDRHPTMIQNTASAGGFSASKAPDKLPNKLVLETDKLRIVYNSHNDTIKVSEQGSANTGSWNSTASSGDGSNVKKESSEGTENEPQSTSNTSNTNQADSGNSGGNSEEDQNTFSNNTDTSDSDQNTNKTPPPQPAPSQPTQEEINNSSEKLKQATQNGNKDELSESIKKNQELEDKGASKSPENEQAEKAAREKLAQQDKKKYCQTIFEATENKLKNNGINVDQLDAESKSEFEKLKNKEITEKSKVDEAEKKIVKNVYEKAAAKKLTNLENKANEAIKNKNEQKMKEVKQELTQLINNSNYQSKKTAAEALQKKLEAALKQNTSTDKNDDIP